MPSTNIQNNVIGKKIFHPSLIIWSYLYLGNVALSHRNKNINARVFMLNQKNPGTHEKNGSNKVDSNGDNQPPKNSMLTSILIKIRFIYSAKKNIAKATPEYST